MARFSTICSVMAGASLLMLAGPSQALTMQECSAKYGAAKSAGTLNGQGWNDFRKSQCGAADTAAKPAEVRTVDAKPAQEKPAQVKPIDAKADEPKLAQAKTEAKTDAKPEEKSDKSARAKKSDGKEAAAPSGPAVFPTAVSPKYAKEKESKQRQMTCLDQYKANKASGGNGGLNWIQKGGGYYSECNKKLKG